MYFLFVSRGAPKAILGQRFQLVAFTSPSPAGPSVSVCGTRLPRRQNSSASVRSVGGLECLGKRRRPPFQLHRRAGGEAPQGHGRPLPTNAGQALQRNAEGQERGARDVGRRRRLRRPAEGGEPHEAEVLALRFHTRPKHVDRGECRSV